MRGGIMKANYHNNEFQNLREMLEVHGIELYYENGEIRDYCSIVEDVNKIRLEIGMGRVREISDAIVNCLESIGTVVGWYDCIN